MYYLTHLILLGNESILTFQKGTYCIFKTCCTIMKITNKMHYID